MAGAELLMRKPQPGFSEACCVLGQAYNYPSKQRSLTSHHFCTPNITHQQQRMRGQHIGAVSVGFLYDPSSLGELTSSVACFPLTFCRGKEK